MNLVVIGAQWGDEGKGKIVDYLAGAADTVLRFSGGANAGHTIVEGDRTYKLHLVPSGVLYPDTTVILGTGMVIDPESLFAELDDLAAQGVEWQGRVYLSDRAHIVLPGYKQLDVQQDLRRPRPIGTTGRGIGISYALKASRDGLRVADLFDASALESLTVEDRDFVERFKPRIRPLVLSLTDYLFDNPPGNLLLEGAQGALLDLDLGTYPFVSSGISGAAGAAIGAGIGPKMIHGVLGVCKAYSTRVGNGPFPTEFETNECPELGTQIREIGGEYGATTGRPRRCGYLDLVALRYACRSNGIDQLAMTKLDVYDGFPALSACVGYRINGSETTAFPASVEALAAAKPVLKTFSGWQSPTGAVRAYAELPPAAREYIKFVEEFVGAAVSIVSVGSRREQTIVRSSAWSST